MNQCPYCGADIADTDGICPRCGKKTSEPYPADSIPAGAETEQEKDAAAPVDSEDTAAVPVDSEDTAASPGTASADPLIKTAAISADGFSNPAEPQKKRKRRRLLIAIGAAVVILLLIAALALPGGDSGEQNTPAGVTDEQHTGSDGTDTQTAAGSTDVASGSSTDANMPMDSTAASGNADATGSSGAPHTGASGSANAQPNGNSGNQTGSNNAAANNNTGSNNASGSNTGSAAVSNTTQTAADPFAEVVNIINSGSYAMEGTMTSGADNIPVGITFCGDMTRMSTDMDGMVLDMAMADGQIYLINPSNKTYMTLTESLMNMMEMDASDLDASEMRWQLADASTAQKATVTIDGQSVDCYTIGEANGSLKIYMSGSEVVQIDVLNTSGNTTGAYKLTSFRGNITEADILPGDDYSSKNFMSFFMDLM